MTSPIRQQYLAIKRQYPDVILFFRLGDFYETFEEDAKTAARVLDITLTAREMGRGQKVPLAGVPFHSAEAHIAKLIAAGYKVAVCEQIGQPAKGRDLVERRVTRVVTPWTSTTFGSKTTFTTGCANTRCVYASPGGSWSCESRPRVDTHPLEAKTLWEAGA